MKGEEINSELFSKEENKMLNEISDLLENKLDIKSVNPIVKE